MARLFEERERAAENLYAHDEELNFLARRRGVQMTAQWAAEIVGLDPDAAATYETRLVDAFIGGAAENQLVETVQADLDRAGKPSMSVHVSPQLVQAIAEARIALRGHHESGALAATSPAESPREQWARHHPRVPSSWGWGL